jgi:hypothetical protein
MEQTGISRRTLLDPLTGAVQDVRPGAAAFPWRRHLSDIQWYVGLPARTNRHQVRSAYDWIGSAHHGISRWSDGGYVNYLEPRRRVGSYYAGNRARLARIVDRSDPDGLFRSAYTPR